MHLSEFDYDLPPALIAQTPAEPRDLARLLVYDRSTNTVHHAQVRDLPTFLPDKTQIVVNNSKVRNARLQVVIEGREQQQELLVLDRDNESGTYQCLIRGKAPHAGQTFHADTGTLSGIVTGSLETPGITTVLVQFDGDEQTVESQIAQIGTVPLPPYITNYTAPPERYQTVYAGPLGSAAAPTAGLHFTPQLIDRLKTEGHSWNEVTLHVGIGTFLPLRQEVIEENALHREVTSITPEVATRLTDQIQSNGPLLAVGTTSLRTLEGHFEDSALQAGTQETNIFIFPGYHIHTANHLLTNFHLPKSSLLVLLAAFLGNSADRTCMPNAEQGITIMRKLYKIALDEKYRFFSYGDAMLIL